jgi:hypothetical protein
MSLEDFKKSVDNADEVVPELEIVNPEQSAAPQPQKNPQKLIKIEKNLVLNYNSDASGCGHIRSLFPMNYLNALFAKSGKLLTIPSMEFIFQEPMLIKARTLYFQRHMAPQHLRIIASYKANQEKFKYKMVWDMDDMIWGLNELQGGSADKGVPTYNFGHRAITPEIKQSSIEVMKMMDLISVSTPFLKEYIEKELKLTVPVSVMQNSVSMFFWGNESKPEVTEDIKKPRVIYTGSPTHYSNIDRLLGDWDNAWLDWVKKSVKNNEIEFVVMGGLPWFFEDIKDKIQVIDWVNSYSYHLAVKGAKADIGIMPLVTNDFNRAKSNLKFLEYSAAGIVGIGTTFTDGTLSPYYDMPHSVPTDATVDDIDNIVKKICNKETYNETIKKQYDYLKDNDHWLESPGYINRFLKVINAQPV